MNTHVVVRASPLLAYFILAFAISWGGVILVVGPGGFPGATGTTQRLLPAVVALMLAGPFVAGLVMTALVGGTAGLRDLGRRLRIWRVRPRWYVLALLTTPLLALGALLLLLPASPAFLPGVFAVDGPGALLASGLLVGLAAGVFEEIGWTGFALPLLLRRHGVRTAGLILGLLWGAWHYIVALWGGGDATGALDAPVFGAQMLFYVAVLPGYRILMTWLYDRTGSLALAILMHASLTGLVLYVLMPPGAGGRELGAWYLVFAVLVWATVALLVRRADESRAAYRA